MLEYIAWFILYYMYKYRLGRIINIVLLCRKNSIVYLKIQSRYPNFTSKIISVLSGQCPIHVFQQIYYLNVWSDVIFPELFDMVKKVLTNWKTYCSIQIVKQASNFYMCNYFQLQQHTHQNRNSKKEMKMQLVQMQYIYCCIYNHLAIVCYIQASQQISGTIDNFICCFQSF